MSDNAINLLDQSVPAVPFKPRLKDRGNGVFEATHSLSAADGTLINPATAEKQDAIVAALANLSTDAKLEALRLLLVGTLKVSATALPLPTGASTEATLAALRTALLAQVDLSTLFVTNGTSYYVRRELVNQQNGTSTISFTDLSGNSVNPDVSTLTPVAASNAGSGTASVTRSIETALFDASASGAGYSTGDVIARVLIIDTSATSIVGAYWHNLTTGLALTNPVTANFVAQSKTLPTGAATDAKVEAVRALLAGILQVSGSVTLGTGSAAIGSITNLFALDSTLTARLNTLGQKTAAASAPVVLASDQPAIAVTGTFFQATQPVSGTVTLGAGSATFGAISNAFVLDATVTARLGTLGQKTSAGSAPVVLASDQSAISVTPVLSNGGNQLVRTSSTDGSLFSTFPAQVCKQATLVNNTGVTIEFQQGGTGVAIPVFNQGVMAIYGITNLNQISVRRTDGLATDVPVHVRWEA